MPTSSEKPLVSVVIPTWNAADYLREAIESAFAQTYRPLEIIVVDDGSTDHTAAVCAAYGDRIRYFHQPKDDKRGALATLRGLKEARGRFVAPLDHDDRWLPEKIERQVAAILAQPETGAVFTRLRLIDSAGNDKGPWDLVGPSGDVFHHLLGGNVYSHSSALYPRAVLDEVGFHDPDLGIGDWDQWLKIARHHPIIMLDEFLVEYRVHEQNYSADRRLMAQATWRVLESHRARLHDNCADCRKGFAAGMRVVANAYLEHFHASLRGGRFRQGLPSLRDAFKAAPGAVFAPRQVLAWGKSLLLALKRAVTGGPRPQEQR
jgi:glycosyltransferase involved in cell wall biosynthesis